ncbi:MAG: hypothetical protein V4640_10580 [Verrucomicrobiota bacterium]
MRALVILCALSLPVVALPPDAAALKAQRDVKISDVNSAYVRALEKIKARAMADGDLAGAQEIEQEIDTAAAPPKPPVVARTEIGKPNPILGKWRWGPSSLIVTFAADGTAKATGYEGKWTEIQTSTVERKYTITWNDGAILDEVTITANGTQARAKNMKGVKFTSEKIPQG